MRILAMVVLACAIVVTSQEALPADPPKGEGLSKAQAVLVAHRYFANEIRMEGAVAEPSQRGDYWVFPLKIGYAGVVARDPILVNRFTGEASWAGRADHKAGAGGTKPGSSK